MKYVVSAAVVVLMTAQAVCGESAEERTYRTDNTLVRYTGISAEYAEAIALTARAARGIAAEHFGLDMPDTVVVHVALGEKTRLFNDGQASLHLTLKSQADLRKPNVSGVFNIYGICHEIAHIAMYRVIKNRMWMTTAAAEGWAHYMGSRLVDVVYDSDGPGLWPDRYNYSEDGTARLKRNLARRPPSELARGSAVWMELVSIVGDKGVAPVFKAWGQAKVAPADPAAALRAALLAANGDQRLSDWWKSAEPLFVMRRPGSDFAVVTAAADALTGKPVELANDDGAPSGGQSMAGSGHAVAFEVDGDEWYLAAVSVYGSRYGTAAPPKEDFHVWLCDQRGREIVEFPFPYSKFQRGAAKAVRLEVTPTKVPRRFYICVGFNPTSTRGVTVHYDEQAGGRSFMALPGRRGRAFTKGDWLIRAEVDHLKAVDPLSDTE